MTTDHDDDTVVELKRTLPAKPKIEETDTGILFPVGMVFSQWALVAKRLQRDHKSFMWKLGDTFLAGEQRFSELYSQAIEEYSIETIRTAMRVCRAFPYERRHQCGFYFHQAIYALRPDEQDELLTLCEQRGWTREAMREEIRERRARAEAASAAASPQLNISNQPATAEREPVDIETETRQLDEQIDAGGDDHGLYRGLSDVADGDMPALVRVVEDMPPLTEPAPADPRGLSTDDASAFLMSVARASLPANIAGAVMVVLAERDRLLRVLQAAQNFLKTADVDELEAAVHRATNPAPDERAAA